MTGRTLLDEIDQLQPQPHGSRVGLRLCVHDVFHGTRLGPLAVSGARGTPSTTSSPTHTHTQTLLEGTGSSPTPTPPTPTLTPHADPSR